MPQVRLLPHPDLCPEGRDLVVNRGASLCQSLLKAGVEIEHACEMVTACSTCHVYVREGGESLEEAGDDENDQLDLAWGLTADWAMPTSPLNFHATPATTRASIEPWLRRYPHPDYYQQYSCELFLQRGYKPHGPSNLALRFCALSNLMACWSNDTNSVPPSKSPSKAITPSAKSPPPSSSARPASTAGV